MVDGKPGAKWDEGGFDGGKDFYHDEKHAKGIDDALSANGDATVGVLFLQSTAGQ